MSVRNVKSSMLHSSGRFSRYGPYAGLQNPVNARSEKFNYSPIIHRMKLATISESILESLRTSKIIPEVIDEFIPKALVSVDYEDGHHAAMGNNLDISDILKQPNFSITTVNDGEENSSIYTSLSYTIAMTCPDLLVNTDIDRFSFGDNAVNTSEEPVAKVLSQQQTTRQFAHFLISGLKLSDARHNNTGSVLLDYMPSFEGSVSRRSRYVFLLYKEDSRLRPRSPTNRINWSQSGENMGVREWANTNKLTLIGANYFNLKS
ncbi:phosphatidylethanolamine-binding protein [Dipodascopsis uninucleata]